MIALFLALALQVDRRPPAFQAEEAGRYGEAFALYGEMLNHVPKFSRCYYAYCEWMLSVRFGQARCLERLNRHAEAVRIYFECIEGNYALSYLPGSDRIVELYEAAGKTDSLWKEVMLREREFRAKHPSNPDDCDPWSPYCKIRRRLLLNAAKRSENLEFMVTVLGDRYSIYPYEYDLEIADFIARHAEKGVPLLSARLAQPIAPDIERWICYTLGLCGTTEAAAILRKKVEAVPSRDLDPELLIDLDLAGREGRKALNELYSRSDDELGRAILKVFGKSKRKEAPVRNPLPIPRDIKLP